MTAESDYPPHASPAETAGPGLLPARAVVVFAEETRLAKLRRLKPGFRHCFAYLALDQGDRKSVV